MTNDVYITIPPNICAIIYPSTNCRWPGSSSQIIGFSWWQATSCHLIPEIIFIKDFNQEYLLYPTISVEVVEDRHAGLLLPSLLHLLPVVRLRSTNPALSYIIPLLPSSSSLLPPSVWPVVELVSIGRRHFHLVSRPEPPVDQLGEKLRLIASSKIAFSPRCPEVRDASWEYFVL